MNKPIAIELFAGAGGLSVGLERAGFGVVLANEIEKDFAATLKLNHPATKVICDDIHNIDFVSELKSMNETDVDLVSGGPPCQGFSTVGSKDRHDPRNSLFYEYLRAVREIRPKYVLFENVSGFMRMYDGEAYRTLVFELGLLGYKISGKILDASDFGLPQKRLRTIIIGWRHDQPAVTFPEPTHVEEPTLFGQPTKISLIDAISDLPPLASGGSADNYLHPPMNAYQEAMRAGCSVLTEHNAAEYGSKMQEILRAIPAGGSVNDIPLHLRPQSYFANTYARLAPDCPAPTITRNFGTPSSSRCVHPFQNRALSTREGARLQGFPDSYKFVGGKGSKNLQIGNAVPPIFGEIIAKNIIMAVSGRNRQLPAICLMNEMHYPIRKTASF